MKMTCMRRAEIGNELIDLELKRNDGKEISEQRIALLYGHLMSERLIDLSQITSVRDAAHVLSIASGTTIKTCVQTMNNLVRQSRKK